VQSTVRERAANYNKARSAIDDVQSDIQYKAAQQKGAPKGMAWYSAKTKCYGWMIHSPRQSNALHLRASINEFIWEMGVKPGYVAGAVGDPEIRRRCLRQ